MSEGLGLSGTKSMLNISTATVVSTTSSNSYASRRIGRVQVITAGTAPGSINDASSVAAAASANQVFTVPNTVGSYLVDFPCLAGIVVTPGTGQVLAVSYD